MVSGAGDWAVEPAAGKEEVVHRIIYCSKGVGVVAGMIASRGITRQIIELIRC